MSDQTHLRPTAVHVDLGAIATNVRRIGELTGTDVCAVVKGDGYGHGAIPAARAAVTGGASWLAVALVEEGRALREAGLTVPILLLSEPPVDAIPALLGAELTPVVYTRSFLAHLDAAAAASGRSVAIHLKADTGMARVGAPPATWTELLADATSAQHLVVDGLLTHLACADQRDHPATADQLAAFDRFLDEARAHGIVARWVHATNTAGALTLPAARGDLVRPGIGIYGLSPGGDVDAADHGLIPALSLVSEVSFVKRVAARTPASYGHRWRAPADGWLATVPIGYADGVPRRLTGVGEVLLGGTRRPIAGTVTMDQVLVWCGGDRPDVGDEVVLLGRQGDQHLRVEEWADHLGTITYEVTSQLTARLPRTYAGTGA